jgi:hypothetical protein
MAIKTTHWLSSILLISLLALIGCGKSGSSTAQRVPGTIDIPKFQQAFAAGTPDQQANVTKVSSSVRYRLYPDALAALEKLSSDPALTEPQKQAVTNMVEGIKAAMAKTPAAPPQ